MRISKPDDPERPNGIGLSALILAALAIATFASNLSQLAAGIHARQTSLPQVFSSIFLLAIGSFTIWSFWKGRDWARVLLLGASFLIAALEVSAIIDNNGDLVVLMSHPLRFLDFAMAAFLLYWLNTRPIRAWFHHVSATAADLIGEQLGGKLCTAVRSIGDIADQEWQLVFEHDAELILTCPWRIVLDDNLAFASNALNNPVVNSSLADSSPQDLLQNLRVKAVRVSPRTSDLFITFEMGIELQTWTDGAKPQQWMYSDSILTVVADSIGLKSQAISESIHRDRTTGND